MYKRQPLDGVDWGKVRQDANTSMVLQMIELSKQGYTQKQIGEKLQVHPSTVCQKLKKAEADGLFDGRCPRVEQAEQNRQHKPVSYTHLDVYKRQEWNWRKTV